MIKLSFYSIATDITMHIVADHLMETALIFLTNPQDFNK